MNANPLQDKVLVINKACGPTSFDVIRQFRRATGLKKVGHTGTLDPLASGVLILCTGVATRAVEHFMDLEKEYEFEVTLGVETTTLDSEGEVTREAPVPELSREDIEAAARHFIGPYQLTPPAFSAIKREGKRLYERARAGEAVEAPVKQVTIYAFDILDVALPQIRCRARCSRGTYVRSLARDLGALLDVPAHITELSRVRVGPFASADAFPSDRLANDDAEGLTGITLAQALSFLPGVVLSRRSTRALFEGARPNMQDVVETIGELEGTAPLRILDESGELLAVGRRAEGSERNRLYLVDSYRLYTDTGGHSNRRA